MSNAPFSFASLIDFVSEVLNRQYQLSLTSGFFGRNDFYDRFQIVDPEKQVFVEVVEPDLTFPRPMMEKAVRRTLDWGEHIPLQPRPRFFVVFPFVLDEKSRMSLSSLQPEGYSVEVLDQNDLTAFAKRNKIPVNPTLFQAASSDPAEGYFVEDDSRLSKAEKSQEPLEEPEIKSGNPEGQFLLLVGKFSGKLYGLGSNWGGDDRTEDFLNGNYWESGDDGKFVKEINAVRQGDIVILKSATTRGDKGIFRVKALGIVQENTGELVLRINWLITTNNLDIPGRLNRFRNRIVLLQIPDFMEIARHVGFDRVKTLFETGKGPVGPAPAFRPPAFGPISADQGDKDSLNFERDVQSLAALIALKEMKPPLAIALFGKWGSGKSFFMRSLRKRVRELSVYQGFIDERGTPPAPSGEAQKELFHRGIAHIWFNAWSYMDANLWAGLAHSMFEKLNLYIHDNTKSDLERLKVQVKITKRLEVLHSDLNNYIEKKERLAELKTRLERDKESRIRRYFSGRYDASVKKFLAANGLSEEQAAQFTPSALREYAKRSMSVFHFFRANAWRITAIVGTLALMLLILKDPIAKFLLTGDLQEWVGSVWGTFTAMVLPLMGAVTTFYAKRGKLIRSLVSLVREERQLSSSDQLEGDLEKTREEIAGIDQLIEEVQRSIKTEYENKNHLTRLAIANFIASRSDHEDYKKHLGIITTIRKDFETLSALFSDLETERVDLMNENETQRVKELKEDRREIRKAFSGDNGFPQLERIVLYIDDLDRCTDRKVLEVLQAVHLLMAYPLFIVVVGVDERCVHNALRYQQLKRYRGMSKEVIDVEMEEISPREYLEKIFQIPFQLPVATPDGVVRLIEDIVQTGDEVLPEPEKTGEEAISSAEAADEPMAAEPDEEDFISRNYKGISALSDTLADTSGLYAEFPPEQKTQEPKQVRTIKPEEISITPEEKELLKKYATLVGRNPRTLKRYINIFRVVKTHQQEAFTGIENTECIIFMIAMLVGDNRRLALSLFHSQEPLTLLQLLVTYDPSGVFRQVIFGMYTDNTYPPFWNELPADLQDTLRFVERFSYKLDERKEKV